MLTREELNEMLYKLKQKLVLIAIYCKVEEDDYLLAIKEKLEEIDCIFESKEEYNVRFLRLLLVQFDRFLNEYVDKLNVKMFSDMIYDNLYIENYEGYQFLKSLAEARNSQIISQGTERIKNMDYIMQKIKSKGGKRNE